MSAEADATCKEAADSSVKSESSQQRISHKKLWEEIEEEFYSKRQQIEEHKKSKDDHPEEPPHPAVEYLNEEVFPLLNDAMVKMLRQMKAEECLTERENEFNGLNFISEYLWNMNPRYPERKEEWTSLSNINSFKSDTELNIDSFKSDTELNIDSFKSDTELL